MLVAVNQAARAQGVEAGLRFSDARARLPQLHTEEIDRKADEVAFRRLTMWMYRYSPIVSQGDGQSIVLETTGCDHLFGGENAMADDLRAKLQAAGYSCRLGLASTPGAAHALAHASTADIFVVPGGDEHEALENLHVSSLRISQGTVTLLRRFGLTRIGQLYGIDRKALARRFQSRTMSDQLVLRLDQALGLRHEPLSPLRPKPPYISRLPCPEPIASTEGVWVGLKQLILEVCHNLSDRGEGARRFSLFAFKGDGHVSMVSVSAARPVRSADHILRLFAERIDKIDPGFGIDMMMLEGRSTSTLNISPTPLSADLTGTNVDETALAALADRITARLGDGVLSYSGPAESHIPERSCIEFQPGDAPPDWAVSMPTKGPRPLRVFDRPERIEVLAEIPDGPPHQFRWRGLQHRVSRSDGPERLSPEWWRVLRSDAPNEMTRARDYYRIEDVKGRRYWIFRQGLYEDGRGGAPDWFIQGLFA